jgi:phage terminase small subunit
MALTPKQERFVSEYLIDLNATQAAIRAGYAKSGARTEGARLLANADIADFLAKAQERVADKAEWTAADRLKMLADIALANVEDDPRVSVSAISEANKMQGSHAPTKQESSGPNGGPIETRTTHTVDPKDIESAIAKLKGL